MLPVFSVFCRLNFDNSAYRYIMKEDEEEQEILPITSDFFFEVFPFNIVFRQVSHQSLLFSSSHEDHSDIIWIFINISIASLRTEHV